jgi:hypothetical protein
VTSGMFVLGPSHPNPLDFESALIDFTVRYFLGLLPNIVFVVAFVLVMRLMVSVFTSMIETLGSICCYCSVDTVLICVAWLICASLSCVLFDTVLLRFVFAFDRLGVSFHVDCIFDARVISSSGNEEMLWGAIVTHCLASSDEPPLFKTCRLASDWCVLTTLCRSSLSQVTKQNACGIKSSVPRI